MDETAFLFSFTTLDQTHKADVPPGGPWRVTVKSTGNVTVTEYDNQQFNVTFATGTGLIVDDVAVNPRIQSIHVKNSTAGALRVSLHYHPDRSYHG